MHLGLEEEITLLEFEEAEEGNPQEDPQAVAPEGVEQNPEELSGVPWPSPYFLSARQAPEHYKSPSNLQMFTYAFMIDALGYKSWMKPLDACTFLVQILHL